MQNKGQAFEDLALAHASKAGLKLVERNFNCRHGELDLIMREREIVVFIEVRYRRSSSFGGPLDSVGTSKQARLIKTAGIFLQTHPELAKRPCRFDVMAICGSIEKPDINWQRNAFETC